MVDVEIRDNMIRLGQFVKLAGGGGVSSCHLVYLAAASIVRISFRELHIYTTLEKHSRCKITRSSLETLSTSPSHIR